MRSPERRPASTLPVAVAGQAALGPVGEGARAGGKLAWPTWRAQLAHQMDARGSVWDTLDPTSWLGLVERRSRRLYTF